MQRRTLFQLGAGAGAVLALAGLGASLWTPGWQAGRLSEPARDIFKAVGRAVLQGVLPEDDRIREQALLSHLRRLEQTLAGLAPATRAELSDLLALLSTAPGRLALTGLSSRWTEASAVEVSQALQAMRLSSSQTRRQVYQAFRDLSNAAWFADAGTWEALGYPGPNPV